VFLLQFPDVFGNQPVIEAATMVIVLLTVFGFGTFTITMLEKLAIPIGVPATDAVQLGKNQSWLLSMEEKWLIPLVKRPTEFKTHTHDDDHKVCNLACNGSKGRLPSLRGAAGGAGSEQGCGPNRCGGRPPCARG
jgi:hypothetical protein